MFDNLEITLVSFFHPILKIMPIVVLNQARDRGCQVISCGPHTRPSTPTKPRNIYWEASGSQIRRRVEVFFSKCSIKPNSLNQRLQFRQPKTIPTKNPSALPAASILASVFCHGGHAPSGGCGRQACWGSEGILGFSRLEAWDIQGYVGICGGTIKRERERDIYIYMYIYI